MACGCHSEAKPKNPHLVATPEVADPSLRSGFQDETRFEIDANF
jgi:hypothetical protein